MIKRYFIKLWGFKIFRYFLCLLALYTFVVLSMILCQLLEKYTFESNYFYYNAGAIGVGASAYCFDLFDL